MDSSSLKNNLKKLSEISGDTKKMEDLLSMILKAIQSVDKSQDDTEDDVEELDKSIDYLSAAITKKTPIDIALDQGLYGRFAKPTNENKNLNNNSKMTNTSEKARWAKLAGLPKKETKQQLDENVVGIGAVNQIFPNREPQDYEMAFEHYLGEMYDSKKENVEEEEMSAAEKEKVDREVDAVRDDLDQISKLAKDAGEDAEDIKDMVDEAELPTVALKGLNRDVKDVKSMAQTMLDIFKQVNDTEQLDYSKNSTFKMVLNKLGVLAKTEIEEAGFGKGSSDGTEGFGDMLYKGMDEMYKKHGKDMVDEILEMYKKSETK